MIAGLFRVQRRRVLLLGAAFSGVTLAAACGGTNDDSSFTPTGGSGGASGTNGSGTGGAGHAGSQGVSGMGGAFSVAGGEGVHAGGAAGSVSSAGSGGGVSLAGAGGSGGSGGASGSGGSAGHAPGGGSGGAAEAGAGGETSGAGEGGEAGANDCSGVHGCPEPTVLATAPNAFGIALDSTYVYWTTQEASGTVGRAPIAGGATQPVASTQAGPGDLAVAGGNAFWCLDDSTVGHIGESAVTGGAVLQLATGVATGFRPALTSITSDGAYAYYVANFNEIAKVAVGVADTDQAYVTPPYISVGPYNSNIQDVVLFGTHLYYTNDGIWNSTYTAKMTGTAAIRAVDLTSNVGYVSLVTMLDFPLFRIAADGTHLFWNNDTTIYSTSMIGGLAAVVTPVTPVTGGASPVADMVSDGTHLYFADAQNVYRVPVGGGTPRLVSWGWQSIKRMAIDAGHVYFTDSGSGSVVEMAK